ncbi:unnamed protein product [Calypogeia fissa]
MRVKSLAGGEAIEQQAFSDWLLAIGEGRLPLETTLGDDVIALPRDMLMPTDNLNDLIDDIYGTDAMNFRNAEFLKDRAILTTINKDVDNINEKVMKSFPAEVKVLLPLAK